MIYMCITAYIIIGLVFTAIITKGTTKNMIYAPEFLDAFMYTLAWPVCLFIICIIGISYLFAVVIDGIAAILPPYGRR